MNNQRLTPNLGWLYYKHYFDGINNVAAENKTLVTENTAKLLQQPLPVSKVGTYVQEALTAPLFGFTLETIYPGLVTGIGMKHETGIAEGELKLGCAFDYTTGLPYVAGSGVKGKLRSFFTKPDYLLYVLNTTLKEELGLTRDLSKEDIILLTEQIFEGRDPDGKRLSAYRSDIFHDAFAVEMAPTILSAQPDTVGASVNESLEALPTSRPFLVKDSITHHPHPLKNPNPVQFLVVGPGVIFRFIFRLFPVTLAGDCVFSAKSKCVLFRYLLSEHGLGAKTNVGYGQFI